MAEQGNAAGISDEELRRRAAVTRMEQILERQFEDWFSSRELTGSPEERFAYKSVARTWFMAGARGMAKYLQRDLEDQGQALREKLSRILDPGRSF